MSPRVPSFACSMLLLGLALSGSMASDTGYDRDYDYPGHGDDWYGRGERDMNRDYDPTDLDLLLSGDDFCLGHDPSFDYLGLGPILERTNTADFEYDFRFAPVPSDLTCTSNIPACNDGDPCTSDSWNGTSCQFVAPPVPGEVDNLTLDLAVPDVATLSWNTEPWADVYDVYRASSAQLGDLACLVDSVPVPTVDDDGFVPAPGDVFYMLVTGRSCSGESTLGDGRINGAPCQ